MVEKNIEQDVKEEWHHIVTMEDLGDLKRKLHVTYDTIAVQMALEKSCELVGKRAHIKGFRRGKAPKQLVQNYCAEEIEKSASSMLVQEGFLHGCFEQKIQPLGEPKPDNAEFHFDGTFTCDITLEVRPTIEASGYVGLKLKKPNINRDEIRERLIENAKHEHMLEIPTDEVKIGSLVNLDFIAIGEDEEKISEGKDNSFIINKDQEPPFGENLVGKKVGDSFVENIVLPENNETYGGKSARVEATIKSIFERVHPTEEDLVVAMQAPSLEDLMNAFTKRADYEASTKEQQSIEEEIISKLLESHSFEVPSDWVLDEAKYLTSQLGLQGNIDEGIKAHIHDMAERNVRRTFMLEAIYDAEPNLKVTKEEFEDWLAREAKIKQVSPLVLKKDLKEKNMLDGVLGLVKHRKVLDFIISQAQITEEVEEQINETYEIPENPLEEGE